LILTLATHEEFVFLCQNVCLAHGGLTPAAPVDVRLCIVEGDFFSQRKSCTKSGWRA
jgi:hypothetical protein